MQEHTHNISIFRVVVAVLDAVMVAYIGSYFYWAFIAGTAGSGFLPGLFEAINPITTGAYLSGAIVLLHLSAYRNVLGRFLIALPYLFTVISSGLMIMTVANWSDWPTLAILGIPHVIIVILAIAIIRVQRRKKEEK